MHHAMLDHFAGRDTPVHRLAPAAKTLSALALILATVLVRRDHLLPFIPVAAALVAYAIIGRVPLWYAVKRLLIIAPFAAAIVLLLPFLEPGRVLWQTHLGPWTVQVTAPGLARAAHLASKFFLCAATTLMLLATTPFHGILEGLTRLRVPRVFVVQLAFLYRYLWVLLDEVMRLRRARVARDAGQGPWRVRFRSHTGLVGVLFLRTFDRAERIYWAMAARGFDGRLPAPAVRRMRARDAAFLAGVLALAAGVLVSDWKLYG